MKAAAQTAARLNLSVTQHAILYKSTVQRWEKRHRVVPDSTPEETTQAHTISCADIRNIVSSLAAFSSIKACNHGNSIASMQLGSLWAMLRGKPTRKRVRPKVEGKPAKILQGPVWFLSSSRQTF